MMTDPIADLLTQIRNANSIRRKVVDLPASRMRVAICEVLKQEGFVGEYEVVEAKPSSRLRIQLKYGIDGEQVIRRIRRISRPGCRIYSRLEDLKPVLRGQGIRIVSTPKGVVSDRKARELRVGGEVLAEVY